MMVVMQKISFPIAICAACLIVAGCSMTSSDGKPAAQQSFEHLEPLRLNVATVDVQMAGPGVFKKSAPDDFAPAVDELAERYFKRRFLPSGITDAFTITLQEVDVTSSYQNSKNSIAKFLDVGGAQAYTLRLIFLIEKRDTMGAVPYATTLTASRRFTIPEHFSIAERESAQENEVERLFQDLDQKIVAIVINEMHLTAG
jgi:hypothetical protein